MTNQKAEEIIRQNISFKKTILILSAVVIFVSVLFLVFGIKYHNTHKELKRVNASVSLEQSVVESSVAAEKSDVEQSVNDRFNEQNSVFEDERNSMNEKISQLNEQIALKRAQQEAESPGSTKTVYLTFDDGPSSNTPQILSILNDNGVRATFFVINGSHNDYMKDIVNSGNQIALHTFSHDYSRIYSSDEAYFDDLNKISDLVYSETGVRTNIIRFPGGSSNTISRKYSDRIMTRLSKSVINKGYYYFDWNVLSGDANSRPPTKEEIIENCKKVPKTNTVIVLMHDTNAKGTTVEALPEVIAYYKSIGYAFGVISEKTYPIHQKINN